MNGKEPGEKPIGKTSRAATRLGDWASLISAPASLTVLLPLLVLSLNADSAAADKRTIFLVGSMLTLLISLCLGVAAQAPGLHRLLVRTCEIVFFSSLVLMALPNRTGELTGFTPPATSGEAGAWIKAAGILASGALVAWRFPGGFHFLNRAFQLLALAILITLLVFVNSPLDVPLMAVPNRTDQAAELGRETNVIVLVMDGFSGYGMAEILAAHPEFTRDLSGFTLYPRAIASSLNTVAGISTILTGDLQVALRGSDPGDIIDASLEHSFLNEAQKKGYSASFVSMLGTGTRCVRTFDEQRLAPAEPLRMGNMVKEYGSFWHIASSRILPPSLCFNDGYLRYNRQRRALSSKRAMLHLIERLHVGDRERCALFMHSKLSHPPYLFSESGELLPAPDPPGTSRFVVRTILRLLNRLKSLDCYDSSLIIVASDHGQSPIRDREMGGLFRKNRTLPLEYNPLLMIKPPRAIGDLRTSEMSAWLGDIAPSVRSCLGIANPAKPLISSRSLLAPEDLHRRLAVPLFIRKGDVSYHSGLGHWKRIDRNGSFADYGFPSTD